MAVTLDGVTFQDSDWLNRGHLTTITVGATSYQRWEGMWVAGIAEINTKVAQVGGLGVAMAYAAETGSTADAAPGDGKLTWDNATQASATTIFLDAQDANGVDLLTLIDTLDDSTSAVKGTLRLTKVSDNSAWILYNVTAVTSASGYRKLTVSAASYSAVSPFADADALSLTFSRTGDKGDTGDATDIPGQTATTLAATDDLALIYDISAGATRKITLANFFGSWTIPAATVTIATVTTLTATTAAVTDLTVSGLTTIAQAGENAEGNATNATGDVILQATGAPVLRHTLTGDVTYLVAGAPTPGHGWQVEVRPTQDGTGGRAVTILPANLWTYSNDIDNAAWAKANATTSTAAGLAPDGQTTAVKMVEASDTGQQHLITRSITKAASPLTYTFEGTLERDGRDAMVQFHDGTGANGLNCYFNLAAGVVVPTPAPYGSGWSIVSYSIQESDFAGFDVHITFTTNSTTTLTGTIYLITAATYDTIYNGDGTSGVIISWLNLVEGSVALGRQIVGATRAGQVVWRTAADEIDFAAQAASTASRILISYGSDGEILVDDVSLVS